MSANSTKEDTTHSSQTGSSSMPSQPVKPKTAFQLFQKARMPRIKAELARERSEHGEGIELGAIMKEVSRQWQQAEKEEKQEFIDAAACDKERYEKDCYERDQVIEADRKRKRDSFSSNTIVEGKRERKRVSALHTDSVPCKYHLILLDSIQHWISIAGKRNYQKIRMTSHEHTIKFALNRAKNFVKSAKSSKRKCNIKKTI